jgi:hypothetical protein
MACAGVRLSTEPTGVCIIRLDSDPPPIQSGCACRSDGGLAHVEYLIAKAVGGTAAAPRHRGVVGVPDVRARIRGGVKKTRLGEAWMSRVCDQEEENLVRLIAAYNLADCRSMDGQFA